MLTDSLHQRLVSKSTANLTRHRTEKAFTLIEIVVSLAIFGIMMTIGYSTLRSIMSAKEALDDSRDQRAISDAILTRLTKELQLAVSGMPIIPDPNSLDKPNSSKTNLIGSQEDLEGDAKGGSISFLALEGGQYLPDGGTHAGIVQITYKVVKNPDATTIPNRRETYLLVRQELPYLRPFEKAYEKAMNFPVVSNIVSLSFSFYDTQSDSWVTSWGTDKRLGLPRMVKLIMKLMSPRGFVESYVTVVPLRSKS